MDLDAQIIFHSARYIQYEKIKLNDITERI